jgi:hypothetical protein
MAVRIFGNHGKTFQRKNYFRLGPANVLRLYAGEDGDVAIVDGINLSRPGTDFGVVFIARDIKHNGSLKIEGTMAPREQVYARTATGVSTAPASLWTLLDDSVATGEKVESDSLYSFYRITWSKKGWCDISSM